MFKIEITLDEWRIFIPDSDSLQPIPDSMREGYPVIEKAKPRKFYFGDASETSCLDAVSFQLGEPETGMHGSLDLYTSNSMLIFWALPRAEWAALQQHSCSSVDREVMSADGIQPEGEPRLTMAEMSAAQSSSASYSGPFAPDDYCREMLYRVYRADRRGIRDVTRTPHEVLMEAHVRIEFERKCEAKKRGIEEADRRQYQKTVLTGVEVSYIPPTEIINGIMAATRDPDRVNAALDAIFDRISASYQGRHPSAGHFGAMDIGVYKLDTTEALALCKDPQGLMKAARSFR